MSIFQKKRSQLSVVLDVGSRIIKGVVFDVSQKDSMPKVCKRIGVQMPAVYPAVRIVEEIHQLIGALIKEFGRVPLKVTAGFGSSLAEYRVDAWEVESASSWAPPAGGRRNEKIRLNQKEVVGYFTALFASHGKDDQAVIAAPVSIEVNGYTLPAGILGSGAQTTLFALGGGVRNISFHTLVSYFPSQVSMLLADMKQMLGGVPLEFVPLALAYREALVNRLKVRDALLIDIGGNSTMLVLFKNGTLAQTASFPFGVSHLAQQLGEKLSMQLEDVSDQLRQYSQGLADEKMQSMMRQHLGPVLETWNKCFCDALELFYTCGPLTGETYVCGGGAYLPELRSYLEKGEWLKNISYTTAPRVTTFEGKSLFSENGWKKFFQGPEDAGIASVMSYQMQHEVLV